MSTTSSNTVISPRSTVRLALAFVAGVVAVTLSPLPAAAEPTIKQLEKRVDEASGELESIVEEHNRLNEEIGELESRHAATEKALRPLRSKAEKASGEVGDIAASLYEAGPAASISPIVSGPPDTLIERISVLELIAQDRGDMISDFADVGQDLKSEEQRIGELDSERDRLLSQKSKKRKAIERDREQLHQLRETAEGHGYRDNPGLKPPPVPGNDAGAAATAVSFAHEQLGKPYKWGGSGPDGYDCSGLTSAAWDAAGVSLPHNAAGQHSAIPHVGRGELQPGDLVFYYPDIRHVAIFVGEGKIIHAPSEGQDVRVSGIDEWPVSGYGRPV